MTDLTLETLRVELAPILESLRKIEAQIDGIPLIHRQLGVIQREARMLRAAFNDFALTNVTSGEISALHEDVNKVMVQHLELETRIATLERLAGVQR